MIFLYTFCLSVFKKKQNKNRKQKRWALISPILRKRRITYQDVCLLDGDRPYDTFIHFQITKMHLLLYIHSFAAYMHARVQTASLSSR